MPIHQAFTLRAITALPHGASIQKTTIEMLQFVANSALIQMKLTKVNCKHKSMICILVEPMMKQ
jgi:hypothetical protein